ncbi:type VI secretion system lipoprotein TssJ, partial [Pseudomonas viridiflava]|uniref:type VI secretion system lipoprotein TssJ n=1 Tax=Pseudomonas viridiflava TaxID=33069 RepID=UPI000F05D359
MSRRSTAFFNMLAALTVLVVLAGCSTLSPYSHVTKLNLKLTASDQVNPDLNGRPSPVVVRLFELKLPVAFENADFFSLYERAKESLAPDMVASEELELRPGET